MKLGLKGWLDKLANKQIPILKYRRDQVMEILDDETRSVSECRSVILSDPGMAANLLSLMNRERLKSNRLPITTISSLLSLLGTSRLRSDIDGMICIEDMQLAEKNFQGAQRCLKQSWYCTQFVMQWAADRNVREPEEVHLASVLQCLPELMLWSYGEDTMLKIEHLAYCECKDYFEEVSSVLGCHKREIGAQLAKKWSLPELACGGFETKYNSFSNGTAVGLAALLSRLCMHGWYDKDMSFFLKKAMHYFGEDEVKTTQHIHQQALDMADEEVALGFQPIASYLLSTNIDRISESGFCLLEDKKIASSADKSSQSNNAKVEGSLDQVLLAKDLVQLKTMVKQKAKMNELLKHVVISLHDAMKFSRVGFLLLSADKLKLESKMHKTTDASDSAIKLLTIEMKQKNLFGLLMKKPQAFSLNKNNYEKYWGLVAGNVKTAIQVDRFCVTSIFFGPKPIGMIYADKLHKNISAEDFKAFQQMTMMLNKALELLAKK